MWNCLSYCWCVVSAGNGGEGGWGGDAERGLGTRGLL